MLGYTRDANGNGVNGMAVKTWNDYGNVNIAGSHNQGGKDGYWDRIIGGGVRGQIIRLDLSWTRTWSNGSVVVRAGQLTSAFGSFLLRYDDAENPLTGMPSAYGYYKPVTPLGLAGAEADFTTGKWDGRVQFTNSSPANPRSLFSQDQYANWAGGAGYTIRQGLRIGMSAYRGPYLDRHHPYYFPGEARHRDLPATGLGVDGEWARGHWNARGELQRFVLAYRLLPTFRETAGYAEVRRVLNLRWFVAARADYLHNKYGVNAFELAAGYRPNRSQLISQAIIDRYNPD